MKTCVFGGGSWGIALASVLNNNDKDVTIVMRSKEQLDYILENGRSKKYLKDFIFPKNIKLSNDYSSIDSADVVIIATPFQKIEEALNNIKPHLKSSAIIVNVSKGLNVINYKTGEYFAKKICPDNIYAVLSGPSHAEEVSKKMVTSVVICSRDIETAKTLQDLFMNDYFRVYIHSDVNGVEVAGALKNVIAIGSGILVGINQGDNARAALITRGLFEIAKLGKKLNCNILTFMGLAGMGDLIVTATSYHSRNFRAGVLIGKGVKLPDIEREVGETVEGLMTVKAAYNLSKKYNVEMPITSAIYKCIYEGADPNKLILDLMTRSKKHEFLEEMDLKWCQKIRQKKFKITVILVLL